MAFLFFRQRLHTFAHLLHTLQKSHELFASLAQRVFRCTKIKLVGARPLHLAYARPLCCLKAPLGLSLLRKRKFLREEHPRQLAAFLCVHLPDGFKDHFACDFCCLRQFVFCGLRSCSCCILPVEVGFDLLGQLQPGFVLRVSVGVHQDRCRCMTCVALHRFEVTARLQQLVGGTGVPLRYNNDKQKKPLFSRGLSVCRLLFNSFSKLKIDENYKEKRRLFY